MPSLTALTLRIFFSEDSMFCISVMVCEVVPLDDALPGLYASRFPFFIACFARANMCAGKQ